ncbi:MAG: hypothetical protein WA317_00635, partial [Mycobacterium sp.]|uniref:hypothetical protein n=1 Tax=Mycobacterium sp. TaxID=1785 RepID=UPI003CC65C19
MPAVDVKPDGRAAALDLHEGLCTPGPAEVPGCDGRYVDRRRGGCLRWPERLWLLSEHGQLVRGRCKATNLCEYCARLAAVENTEMLALDAMEGDAPECWAVLTTRTATLDMAVFYRGRAKVIKAVRRRWPEAEYASLLEFTTGYGPRSGGRRRPHWNLLVKGVRSVDVDELREVIVRVWCGQVDAGEAGQHVGLVRDCAGLMRYIALHFQKESQAPPEGFRGQRFNCSRGYFTGRTRAEARELARESLWLKRQLHRAGELGLEGDDAEDWIDDQLAREGLPEWRLYAEPRRRSRAEPVRRFAVTSAGVAV